MKVFLLSAAAIATFLFQNPQIVSAVGGNSGVGRQFQSGGSVMPELGSRRSPCNNSW